jgi:hypothetical protein
VRRIEKNAAEAAQLFAFATHGADVSTARRERTARAGESRARDGDRGVRRRRRLDAVDAFEVEALRAESTLDAIVEDSRDDLAAARDLCAVPPSPPR